MFGPAGCRGAATNPDTLSFAGTNPEECEAFVFAIRRALEQGKHRDNEWIAVFASSCFAGDAFYWYEELDEDVQNDWSRPQPAPVARFGRGSISPILAPG